MVFCLGYMFCWDAMCSLLFDVYWCLLVYFILLVLCV